MDPVYTKIGLLDHLGGGNLGDDATLAAVMHNIKTRWPDAVVIGLTLNPKDTQTRHGIPTYAIRTKTWDLGYRIVRSEVTCKDKLKSVVSKYRSLFSLVRAIYTVAIRMPRTLFQEFFFLCKSFRIIKSFDLLIINGGGQLTEWGGPWLFPYTIFKWILLARLAHVKRVFLNVGAGPLTHPLSKFFVRRALLLADYASFRDENSRTVAHKIGFTRRSQVCPDSVYSLPIPALNVSGGIRRTGKLIVGIAPMPYCDPRVYPEKDQVTYDGFIRKLALFGASLIRRDYTLALFGSDIGIDPLAIEDLHSTLRSEIEPSESNRIDNAAVHSGEELLARMSTMDYVVTCRFHGVVFAHMLNIPVLAISHHPKVASLMHDLGLSQYCVDIRKLDVQLLTDTFLSLVSSHDAIRRRMAERLACYKRELTLQFDDLFAPKVTSRILLNLRKGMLLPRGVQTTGDAVHHAPR